MQNSCRRNYRYIFIFRKIMCSRCNKRMSYIFFFPRIWCYCYFCWWMKKSTYVFAAKITHLWCVIYRPFIDSICTSNWLFYFCKLSWSLIILPITSFFFNRWIICFSNWLDLKRLQLPIQLYLGLIFLIELNLYPLEVVLLLIQHLIVFALLDYLEKSVV